MAGFDRINETKIARGSGTLILAVASNGTYGPDDTLRIVGDDYFQFDCATMSLDQYLQHPLIAEVQSANMTLPGECRQWAWAAYCVGGSTNGRLVNRYSALNSYDHKSALCNGLTHIYSVLARALIDVGYPREQLFERLDRASSRLQ